MQDNTVEYNTKVFDVTNINEAKNIILTKEAGMDTDERWKVETPFLKKDISKYFATLDENSVILDFGCGIGRISKELINHFSCKVIGVDISESMRKLANEYVDSRNFNAISPAQLKQELVNGLRFDAAISICVLQHSYDPIADIAMIKAVLKKDALFYVLNNTYSAVPTNKGWKNNGINIFEKLENKFSKIEVNSLPNEVAKDKLQNETFILKLKNDKEKTLDIKVKESLDRAIVYYNKKDYQSAKKIYEDLIKKFDDVSDFYNSLAVICKVLGEVDLSIKLYNRAIVLDPLNSYIYANLSNAFVQQKEYQKAISCLSIALKLKNNSCEYYNSLGILFEKVNNRNEAIACYKKAIEINPKFLKAVNNLGVLFYKTKEYDNSVSIFQIAIDVDPSYKEIYSNMGAALNKANRFDEAIIALNKAIKYNPNHCGAYTNLGNVYNKLYDYKKAATLHEKSIKLDPKGYNAYSNVGTSYKNMGMIKKAIDSYKKAIELHAHFENAHFDLATVYLSQRDFKKGFSHYEWRFKKDEMLGHINRYKEIFLKERFDGKINIEGKTLLLHTEQGYGDSIMFAKFLPLVKQKYKCKIVLQCRDELKTLFENSFKDVDIFYGREKDKMPAFDYQYPMLSIPHLLDIESVSDIPNDKQYLYAKKEDDNDLNIKKDKTKIDVGICWSASVTGESYDGKVFDVNYFKPLLDSDRFNVYTLQVGVENKELKENNLEKNAIDLTSKLTDFNKSAYLMSQLDMVISSDTSVAHLAGALGVRVIVPLQKIPDWRWENKGAKSYWYPSAELYRQKSARKWQGVFQSIYAKLNKEFKLKLKLDI